MDSSKYADIVLPQEKNITDMEACIDHAICTGCDEIAVLGATGGRLDHFLGNIGLLERAGGKAFILDDNHEIRILGGSQPQKDIGADYRPYTVQPPHRYRYFSVIPLGETVNGITITGAKYPLDKAVLHRAATKGISNEPIAGKPFSILINNGSALLILSERRT
jgi:thiamine pyrophosphokinase